MRFENVSISFGSNHVLKNVSFDVPAGRTTCILGRSGVGKSVCLNTMMGFLKPDNGRVIVADENITSFSEDQLERLHEKVTMVFQNGALFDSLTVAENVAFPLRDHNHDLDEEEIDNIVDGLLEIVGLKEYREWLPSDISTGMKRSVAIVRALAAEPEAVLFDEPTTMVDPLMEHHLTHLMQRFQSQLAMTSVVVTHDTRLVREIADKVIFLEDSGVVFSGTVAEWEHSTVPIAREFLQLDSISYRALLPQHPTPSR